MATSLTLIPVPAGSELSSLLTRWVTGAACPAAYLRLTPDHDSLPSFAGALIAAVADSAKPALAGCLRPE